MSRTIELKSILSPSEMVRRIERERRPTSKSSYCQFSAFQIAISSCFAGSGFGFCTISSERLRGWLALGQQNMFAVHHDLAALIEDFAGLDDAAVFRAIRLFLFFLDRDTRVNRVADENGLGKSQAVVAVSKRGGIDLAGGEADADGKRHGAMRDAAAERRGARELLIHVMREKISSVA